MKNNEESKAEEKVLQDQRELWQLIDVIPQHIFVLGPDGSFLYANQGVLEYCGLTLEEVQAEDHLARILHPDDLERVLSERQRAISSGAPFEIEARILGKDGHYRWFLIRINPLRDDQGRIIRWYGTRTDIEDRKQAEDTMRRSESYFSQMNHELQRREAYLAEVQRLSDTGSFGWSVSSGELFWSDETFRITGYDRAIKPTLELVFQRVHPEDREFFQKTIDRASHDGKDFDFEHRLLMSDGSVKYIHAVGHAIRNESGKLEFVGTVMDITERKIVEKALRETLDQLSKKNRYETIISTVTRAVHSSINLQDVFENAVEAMSKNIERADNVSIYTVEGKEIILKAYRGYPDWYIERVRTIPYGRGFTWRAIIDGNLRYCADVDQDTVIGPAGKEIGTKSYVSMPICFEGNPTGAISINSLQKNSFDEEELKLLETVAQQIEIAINNAQKAEALQQSEEALRESLAQLSKKNRYETIISTVTRSVHQSINLQEVLENAVESMNKNIDKVQHLAIYLVEGEEAIIRAYRGFPDWFIERAGRIPYPKGLTWKTIIEGKSIYCADTDQDTAIGPAGKEAGIKSYVSMPIFFEGKVVGTLNITSLQKNNFEEEELKLLETVAQQIEIAINNAQKAEALQQSEEALRESLAQLSKKNRYESIISAVTQSVHKSINLQEVMENAVESMNKNIDTLQRVEIFLVEGEEAVLKAYKGSYPDWFLERVKRIPYPRGFTWKTIIEGKSSYVADVDQDTAIGPAGREVGTKSYVSMPIYFEGKTVGALNITSQKKNAFDEDELNLLGIVSQQIEAAINNAKQAGALREALLEVEQLKNRLQVENIYLQEEIKTEYNFEEIIGQSAALQKVLRKVEQVAPTESTVLIQGETGTGKELVARAIHNLSPRKDRPLVKVNCPALPAGLIESELFGHEKGAFTGALSHKVGRFELANDGTIFLDEIGDLPLELQAKLLRVLQEGEFERVGGSRTIKVDVRVIAATNRDLKKATQEGKFRSDLYYRLNVFPIPIPPLRERKEDILGLVRYFAMKYGTRLGKKVETIPQETMDALMAYTWPGNVRELENMIERAVIIAHSSVIQIDESLEAQLDTGLKTSGSGALEDVERVYILRVLDETNWTINGKRGAASVLGLDPGTLRSRMKKLGIKRPGRST